MHDFKIKCVKFGAFTDGNVMTDNQWKIMMKEVHGMKFDHIEGYWVFDNDDRKIEFLLAHQDAIVWEL